VAFIAMGILRYAYSLDLQMHIFDKRTSGVMLVLGGLALGGGYFLGGYFLLMGYD
jgi:hypothetical protein